MASRAKAFTSLLLILCGSLLLTACAHQAPTRSGFLADYADLRPLAKDAKVETASSPGIAPFASVILEEVQFAGEAAAKVPEVASRRGLTRALAEALETEFADLTSPSSDPSRTLRVRAAITGIDPSNPLFNLVTALALFVPVDNGGVSVEFEAVDGESGERIAAMSGARNGSLFALKGFFRRYGHAEEGLAELARVFRGTVPVAPPPARRIAQN